MKSEDDLNYMCEPVTPIDVLKTSNLQRHSVELLIMQAQAKFCRSLEEIESKHGECKFKVDKWTKGNETCNEGGGITCVLQDGAIFEKAGVNISVICGKLTKEASSMMKQRGVDIPTENCPFNALGISCVIHPVNPMCPTIHFNFRYFELHEGDITDQNGAIWWFGGGVDLTPYYLFNDDCADFHRKLKHICDASNPNYYSEFKLWCDNYFRIIHRGENRGIGGIFFDDLNEPDFESCLKFVSSCAMSVSDLYVPIINIRKDLIYTEENKTWQLIRRGRYVEFNLVYDRGTKFGLHTPNSRIESILISLPKHASWEYCHEPKEESEEGRLMRTLKSPIEWV